MTPIFHICRSSRRARTHTHTGIVIRVNSQIIWSFGALTHTHTHVYNRRVFIVSLWAAHCLIGSPLVSFSVWHSVLFSHHCHFASPAARVRLSRVCLCDRTGNGSACNSSSLREKDKARTLHCFTWKVLQSFKISQRPPYRFWTEFSGNMF